MALVLVGLLGSWAFTMGLGPDSDIGKFVCGMLILGSTLLGWHTALGLSRPELALGRSVVTLSLLLILHLAADGITIIMRVAGVGWSYRLAMAMCHFLLLGAWQMSFNLFCRVIKYIPGRCWHFPLALALWGLSYLGFVSVSTMQPYLVIVCMTLGAFGCYLVADFISRS